MTAQASTGSGVTRAIVVTDSSTDRRVLCDALQALQVDVVGRASNRTEAMALVQEKVPDLVLVDLDLPKSGSLDLLCDLRQHHAAVTIIGLDRVDSGRRAIQALANGAADVVTRPVGHDLVKVQAVLQSELAGKVGCADDGSARARDSVFTRRSARRSGAIEAVGIGISTGGPEALTEMLPMLPGNLRVPVLIVQHMPEDFTASIVRCLDERSVLSVRVASDGCAVRAGEVYIAPGDRQMKLVCEGDTARIRLTDDPPEAGCKPAADYLFRSLVDVYGDRVLGVVMTGMGYDGTEGCRILYEAGASIYVQDEDTSVVYGMPRSVMEAGYALQALPLNRIADAITESVRI